MTNEQTGEARSYLRANRYRHGQDFVPSHALSSTTTVDQQRDKTAALNNSLMPMNLAAFVPQTKWGHR